MQILYYGLLVIHIASAAILFGGSVGLIRNLRTHLQSEMKIFAAIVEDAARRSGIIGMFSILTLLTGLGLIFVVGGFGAVPINIHISLTLMLIALAVSITLMRPATGRLVELTQAESLNVEAATAAVRKLTMGQGILHLLWIVILTMMIVPIPR